MAVGFAHLSMVLPEGRESVFTLADMLDEPLATIDAMHRNGLSEVPVKHGATTAGLAADVIGKLIKEAPWLHSQIQSAIIAHSLPAPVPQGYDLIGTCLDQHGLSDIPAVVMSGQPCAILHQAFALARDRVATGAGPILVVGADVPNHPTERLFFGSAMGDGAVACVVTADSPQHHILASVTETCIEAWEGEYSPPDAITRFRDANSIRIRAVVEHCLEEAGLGLHDVTLFCPHTSNRLIWNAVAELLRISRGRIFDDAIARTGHLNSNDSLVHYLYAIETAKLRRGDVALLVNPGFGGTRGCTLIRY